MTKKQRVRIVTDSDPANPRDRGCYVGRMICWHNRYNLGDEHEYGDPAKFREELACEANDDLEEGMYDLLHERWNRLYTRALDQGYADFDSRVDYANRFVRPRIEKLIDAALAGFVILPLYLMDHSGITMSTGAFGCPWDSRQVGWIVCDKETIEREFDGKRERAEKCLIAEVLTYDQYLTGDVYGFVVEERDGDDGDDWDHVDSCYGFYGSDVRENGMSDHLGSDELVELAASAEIECPQC